MGQYGFILNVRSNYLPVIIAFYLQLWRSRKGISKRIDEDFFGEGG